MNLEKRTRTFHLPRTAFVLVTLPLDGFPSVIYRAINFESLGSSWYSRCERQTLPSLSLANIVTTSTFIHELSISFSYQDYLYRSLGPLAHVNTQVESFPLGKTYARIILIH